MLFFAKIPHRSVGFLHLYLVHDEDVLNILATKEQHPDIHNTDLERRHFMKSEDLIVEKVTAGQMGVNKLRPLWDGVKRIEENCANHLSQISAQMPDYDIHDEKHSLKVLEKVEKLLGEKATELTFYELILLHLSCYLHDAAMALPAWEYELLRAVEGSDAVFDNTAICTIRNDFKPPQSLAELKSLVAENKAELYGDFSKVTDFVFSSDNEEEFQLDLARRIQSYEHFRNEYAEQLESETCDPRRYFELSRSLRIEFIRKTHHIRVVDYIRNLKQPLAVQIGAASSAKFIEDISVLCRSHGEGPEFIKDMSIDSHIEQIGEANLQYIAVLLRLGDVIHFSADRAPLSLLSEKRILDKASRIHWETKQNETRYQIINQNGKTVIKFSAYCTEPSEYYFLSNTWILLTSRLRVIFLSFIVWNIEKLIISQSMISNSVTRSIARMYLLTKQNLFRIIRQSLQWASRKFWTC